MRLPLIGGRTPSVTQSKSRQLLISLARFIAARTQARWKPLDCMSIFKDRNRVHIHVRPNQMRTKLIPVHN